MNASARFTRSLDGRWNQRARGGGEGGGGREGTHELFRLIALERDNLVFVGSSGHGSAGDKKRSQGEREKRERRGAALAVPHRTIWVETTRKASSNSSDHTYSSDRQARPARRSLFSPPPLLLTPTSLISHLLVTS